MLIQIDLNRRTVAPQTIAAAPGLLAIPTVRDHLLTSGLRVITSSGGTLYKELCAVPSQSLALVLVPLPPLSGLSAAHHIKHETEKIRRVASIVPIAFLSERPLRLTSGFLAAGVYVLSMPTLDLLQILDSSMARRRELSWETRNGVHNEAPVCADRLPFKPPWTAQHATANFNLKHPSMVVPFALASKYSRLDVFCEVSAREIALYHNLKSGDNLSKTLAKHLSTLRGLVDDANAAFGTNLRIHLDHCDDLDLIRAACDARFDTVMADGSGRGLEQNITFTNAAARIASPYGIPLEGEVGSIDGGDRWGKTLIDEFDRFVSATDINFLGVSLGQFHGFDYGFAAARGRLAEIAEINQGNRERQALVEACVEMCSRLNSAGIRFPANEFQILGALVESAMTSAADGPLANDLMDTQRVRGSLQINRFIDDLEELFFAIQLKMTKRKKYLWDSIFCANKHHDTKYGLFEHQMLAAFARRIAQKGPALVLHGGSSISRSDLECLPATGVARVNFGTEVFRDYVLASAEGRPHNMHSAVSDHQTLMALLDGATADWRAWLSSPPAWIVAYADELVASYVQPLAGAAFNHSGGH